MKRAHVSLAGWLLSVAAVVALCVSPVFGGDSGDTSGNRVMPDFKSCANTDNFPCGCCKADCTTSNKPEKDCVNKEDKITTKCNSPSGVKLSFAESFAFMDDDGPNASPVGSSCSSCGTAGASIPEDSQLPRLRLLRIWRSTLWFRGSFGSHMFTAYDYAVRGWAGGDAIQFMDPNTGNIEWFRRDGGGAYYPVNTDYHTKIVEATDAHIIFEELGGRRLRFAWTGYVESGEYNRARLESLADRNGNQITFEYVRPATDTTLDVLMWRSATDPYGRQFQFEYVGWLGGNFISQVTLPDGRVVQYFYDESLNYFFANRINYGDGIESNWTFDPATQTHTRNEAQLAADHYQQQIQQSEFAPGRTRNVKRADGTLLYSRQDTGNDDLYISTTYHRGETSEIMNSPTKPLISHRQQRVDGSWEELTTYDADDHKPVKRVAQPDGRIWDTERDEGTDRVIERRYPDGSFESFTHNRFAQMTGHVHRSGAIEAWDYDARGNLLSHTEAAGVGGGEATERWTYNGRGQVLTHTDFNGNVTRYDYYPNGELEKITLPGSTGQPAGRITYAYDDAGRIESITDPAERRVDFGYDAAGRLIKTTFGDDSTEETTYGVGEFSARTLSRKDRNGNRTVYSYDATGRVLTTQVQEAGSVERILSTMTNTWDAPTGRLMAEDRDGDRTEYTYDYKARVLTTTIFPEGSRSLTTTNRYDQYHLLSTTDPYGREIFYSHDLLDRVTRTVRETVPGAIPEGTDISTLIRNQGPNAPYLIEDYVFDAQGRLAARIDGRGIRYEYGYDARDRRTLERSAVGTPVEATERYTYDGNNNQLTTTDKNGGVWRKTYTARDAIRTDANPLGQAYTYAYYADGLRATETNPNGHTTRFVYDTCCGVEAGGRLIEIIDADDGSTRYEYDPNGNRTKATDQSGRVVEYRYDGLNRQTLTTVDPGGLNLQTTNDYDQTASAIGRKMTVTSPAGQRIITEYDGLGRVQRVSGDTPEVVSTYDKMVDGYLETATTVALGTTDEKTDRSHADGAGRTVRTLDGLDHPTQMFYDNNGNLVRAIDRDGKRTGYEYDARNRRTTMTDDEGGINAATRYRYDPVGNLLQITDAEGKVTRYRYDAAHRSTSATFAFNTPEVKTWRYEYWPMGQLRRVTKPSGVVINYAYDNLERLSTRAYSTGGTDTLTYHANSLLKRAVGGLYNTTVDRSNLHQDYDRANRLLQERQDIGAGAKTVAYTFHPDSLINQITYPGGTTVQHTRTSRRELEEVRIGGAMQVHHTYDLAGRLESRTYANGRTTGWAHDDADRITNLNHQGVQAWDYRYTDEGDMLVQDDRTTISRGEAYAYDGLHRLSDNKRGQVVGTTVPATPNFSQDWTLDKVGNWTAWNNNGINETRTHNNHHALTSRKPMPDAQSDYDANGNQSDDGVSLRFEHDAEDRLQRVTNRATPGDEFARYRYDIFGRRVEKLITGVPNQVVRYYYSGARIIEERDGGDAVQATYTYGNYIDEPLTMDRGGDRYYYHSNRLFTTYALTSASGEIVERYSYTPYGEMTAFDAAYQNEGFASRVGNPFTFTGREFDVETGLMHFRARTYDPVQGRFKQRDPLGYVDGMNLYAGYFVPVDLDPFGLVSVTYTDPPNNDTPWKDIPWEDGRLPKGKAGNTDPQVKVTCECVDCPCPPNQKGSQYVKCTITADYKIRLDLKQLGRSKKLTPPTAYGHEQRHVQSFHNQLKKLADERRKQEQPLACAPPSNCKNRAKNEKKALERKVTDIYNREAAHDRDAHPDAPPAGEGLDPLTPFPSNPSDAPSP